MILHCRRHYRTSAHEQLWSFVVIVIALSLPAPFSCWRGDSPIYGADAQATSSIGAVVTLVVPTRVTTRTRTMAGVYALNSPTVTITGIDSYVPYTDVAPSTNNCVPTGGGLLSATTAVIMDMATHQSNAVLTCFWATLAMNAANQGSPLVVVALAPHNTSSSQTGVTTLPDTGTDGLAVPVVFVSADDGAIISSYLQSRIATLDVRRDTLAPTAKQSRDTVIGNMLFLVVPCVILIFIAVSLTKALRPHEGLRVHPALRPPAVHRGDMELVLEDMRNGNNPNDVIFWRRRAPPRRVSTPENNRRHKEERLNLLKAQSPTRMWRTASLLKSEQPQAVADIDTCAVCIDTFKPGDEVRCLRCGHVFCKDCIDPWLIENGTCPLCKMLILEHATPTQSDRTLTLTDGGGDHGGGDDDDDDTGADVVGGIDDNVLDTFLDMHDHDLDSALLAIEQLFVWGGHPHAPPRGNRILPHAAVDRFDELVQDADAWLWMQEAQRPRAQLRPVSAPVAPTFAHRAGGSTRGRGSSPGEDGSDGHPVRRAFYRPGTDGNLDLDLDTHATVSRPLTPIRDNADHISTSDVALDTIGQVLLELASGSTPTAITRADRRRGDDGSEPNASARDTDRVVTADGSGHVNRFGTRSQMPTEMSGPPPDELFGGLDVDELLQTDASMVSFGAGSANDDIDDERAVTDILMLSATATGTMQIGHDDDGERVHRHRDCSPGHVPIDATNDSLDNDGDDTNNKNDDDCDDGEADDDYGGVDANHSIADTSTRVPSHSMLGDMDSAESDLIVASSTDGESSGSDGASDEESVDDGARGRRRRSVVLRDDDEAYAAYISFSSYH